LENLVNGCVRNRRIRILRIVENICRLAVKHGGVEVNVVTVEPQIGLRICNYARVNGRLKERARCQTARATEKDCFVSTLVGSDNRDVVISKRGTRRDRLMDRKPFVLAVVGKQLAHDGLLARQIEKVAHHFWGACQIELRDLRALLTSARHTGLLGRRARV
jgi:hypothetical protein